MFCSFRRFLVPLTFPPVSCFQTPFVLPRSIVFRFLFQMGLTPLRFRGRKRSVRFNIRRLVRVNIMRGPALFVTVLMLASLLLKHRISVLLTGGQKPVSTRRTIWFRVQPVSRR